MSSSCIVSSLDGSIEFSVDPRSLPTVGDLRTELRRRYESLAAASVSFVRSGTTLDDSAATLVDGDDAHVTVVVNKRPTASPPAVAIATGLTARDLRDAEDAERAAQIGDALFATNDNPDPSTYEVRLPPVPADVLQSMIDIGFLEQRARKALLLARFNLEDAVEWLALHQDDSDIDEPLSFAQLKALNAVVPRVGITVCDALRAAIDAGVCTFAVTGKQFVPQYWLSCETCNFGEREGVCVSCARRCHRGHKLSAPKASRRFYCDCQARPDACFANGVFKH
jgi:hypothetical protein